MCSAYHPTAFSEIVCYHLSLLSPISSTAPFQMDHSCRHWSMSKSLLLNNKYKLKIPLSSTFPLASLSLLFTSLLQGVLYVWVSISSSNIPSSVHCDLLLSQDSTQIALAKATTDLFITKSTGHFSHALFLHQFATFNITESSPWNTLFHGLPRHHIPCFRSLSL